MLTNYRMLTCFARFLNTSTYSTNCTQTHTKHATPSWQTAPKHIPNMQHRLGKLFGICLSAVCQDGVACLVYVSVQFVLYVLVFKNLAKNVNMR